MYCQVKLNHLWQTLTSVVGSPVDKFVWTLKGFCTMQVRVINRYTLGRDPKKLDGLGYTYREGDFGLVSPTDR